MRQLDRSLLAATLAAATLAAAAPRPAHAAWPPEGRAVTSAPDAQIRAAIATDGADGALVAWQDARSPRVNVFARRLLANGEPDAAWPADGRALLGDSLALAGTEGGQRDPILVCDGAGGAIAAWLDDRHTAVTGTDLFAQRVRGDGTLDPAWPANGVALCTAPGAQGEPVIVPDGKGGAIVAWEDERVSPSAPDIYAQHVLSSGVVDPAWPADGLPVCTAAGPQVFPALLADGLGGALVVWQDDRDSATTRFDVYAEHVLSTGTVDPAWPLDGVAVCRVAGDQGRPVLVSDGGDGALVAWSDARVPATSHIFATHLFGAGGLDRAWPVGGQALSGAALIESRPLAVSDGLGGAIVTWQGFTSHLNLYAQHVTNAGVLDPAWPSAGLALTDRDRAQTNEAIVPDGASGAIVAWQDSFDIVSQHVRVAGVIDPAFPDSGRVLCGLPSQQAGPGLVATGDGGAIAAWTDGRNGNPDIFALQVLAVATADAGPPPVAPPVPILAAPSPNPARESLTLRFALPRETLVRLAIFDATGRRVSVLVSGTRPAGGQSVAWNLRDDRGAPVRPGIYYARLDAEGHAWTRKLVRIH